MRLLLIPMLCAAALLAGCPDPAAEPVETTIPNVKGQFILYPKHPNDHIEPMFYTSDDRYGKPALTLLPDWKGVIEPAQHLMYRSYPEMTDADVKALGKLKELKHVYFHECPALTDAGLKELTDLNRLETLSMYRCAFTDAGLLALTHIKTISKLEVAYCPGISDAPIEEFKKTHPGLKTDILR